MKNLKDVLTDIDACPAAVKWVGNKSPETAWGTCERGDWMIWLAAKMHVDLRIITAVKVKCASLVKHLMEERSLEALNIAKKFAEGNATREELDAAAAAAYAAAASAAADAAADAAAYAAAAAAAANAAADAAVNAAAANAANAATANAANADADAYASWKETLQKCASICREEIPLEMITKNLNL